MMLGQRNSEDTGLADVLAARLVNAQLPAT
jgi:hypothetical protein